MNISRDQLEQLVRIYNTLLNVSTRGEDTLIMADCLRALERVVKQINEEQETKTGFTPEAAVE